MQIFENTDLKGEQAVKKRATRFLTILLAFAMIAGMCGLTAPAAAEEDFDASWTAISNDAELCAIDGTGKYYLTQDITIDSNYGVISFPAEMGIPAFPTDKRAAPSLLAGGIFDGNGHTITFAKPVIPESFPPDVISPALWASLLWPKDTYTPFFHDHGVFLGNAGLVRNLNVVVDWHINGRAGGANFTKGAVADVLTPTGKIENCHVTVTENGYILGYDYAGGIVGRAGTTSTTPTPTGYIKDCSVVIEDGGEITATPLTSLPSSTVYRAGGIARRASRYPAARWTYKATSTPSPTAARVMSAASSARRSDIQGRACRFRTAPSTSMTARRFSESPHRRACTRAASRVRPTTTSPTAPSTCTAAH